jgi:hypothetical protein
MQISFSYDWHHENHDFNIIGKTKSILYLEYDSTESIISLKEIPDNNLYAVELWGGEGPTRNECIITDTKNACLIGLSAFIEAVHQYASKEDIEANQKKIDEIKSIFFK